MLEEARSARGRVHQAAYHELHRDRYEGALGEAILARVPAELEAVTEDVVTRSAARFGFQVEEQSGRRVWHIEYGGEALIDHLPGVMPGSVFRGTFDREQAVEEETLDFFASGHPLVEGVLAELEEGPRGRVAMLQVPGEREEFGLLAILRKEAEDRRPARRRQLRAVGARRPGPPAARPRQPLRLAQLRKRRGRAQAVDQPAELVEGHPPDGASPARRPRAAGAGGLPGPARVRRGPHPLPPSADGEGKRFQGLRPSGRQSAVGQEYRLKTRDPPVSNG